MVARLVMEAVEAKCLLHGAKEAEKRRNIRGDPDASPHDRSSWRAGDGDDYEISAGPG